MATDPTKKQIFDDSFDPLALSISAQEKRNMVKELGAAAAGMEQEQAAQKEEGERKASPKKPQQQLKTSFWDKIVRFFVMLFTGVRGEEYLRRKKLKALRRELKKIRPPVYNVRKDLVAGNLASQLFVLFEYLMPYRTAFNSIFTNEESQPPLTFQLLFLKSCSANRNIDKVSVFEEENLEKITAAHDENLVREKVRQALKKYLGAFSEEDRKRINRTFVEMMHIRDLLEFDYIAFLEKFNRDFSLHQKARPVFNDARPAGLVFLLKRLHTVLLMVNPAFIPDVLESARQFYRAGESGPGDEERDALISIMDRMSAGGYRSITAAISKLIQDARLQLLVRYIDKDFQWAPNLRKRDKDFFREFARTLADAIEHRLNNLFKQKASESFGKKLFALLNIREIPSNYIYSHDRDEMLAAAGLPVFLYAEALNLTILFMSDVYAPKLRPFLNKVIAEGHFPNNEMMRSLSEDVHNMDAYNRSLNDFCAMVTPDTDKGMVLDKMLARFKGDAPSKNAMTVHINSLNKELGSIMTRFIATATNLVHMLGRDDVRKSLAHTNDQKLGARFDAVQETMQLFMSLLRNVYRPE